ncbi:glycosyl hydrolase family 28-related protein [Paenibacillus phoenicis]|uniref:Glycosyl hydrolase family 28-related protein n=1 Tax=Paenibacillus phoenicis TaxID=554117 RepID=A0ABU5PQQ9_9BACL|nr:glycosyl hydrolase family 28-related protein [Paenibacillus phoenicis]MEA3572226.1 glycosyl hydrolase family 28-related protein [Paenibacillus phoenicis]
MIVVTNFGAKGNGVTDDTAAIQKAFNQAAATGDTVYFPKGVYLVNPAKTLKVGGNTTVKGDGHTSIIRAASSSFGWELMRVSGSNILLTGIVLDGNRRVNRVLTIAGGSSRVNVQGLLVQGATHSSDRRSEYNTGVVSGIVVLGNTESIMIQGTEVADVIARNMGAAGLVARGIYVTTTWGSKERAARQVSITGCYIHQIGPADDGDGIYYEDPAMEENRASGVGSSIVGNRFDECAKRAVKVFAKGVTIRGNTINNPYRNNNYYKGADQGRLAPDMYSAISIYGGDCVVEGNQIAGGGSFYAAIEVGAGPVVDNVTIQGNSVTMGSQSEIKGTTAIRLGNIRDFVIRGNTLNHGERGIWTWQNAENGRIESNVIRMLKGGGIDLTTYLRGYTQKNIVCTGNQITASTFKVKTSSSTNSNVVAR